MMSFILPENGTCHLSRCPGACCAVECFFWFWNILVDSSKTALFDWKAKKSKDSGAWTPSRGNSLWFRRARTGACESGEQARGQRKMAGSKSKYDIPYAMTPVNNSRKKKTKYSRYIDEKENRLLSTPGRKLAAYVLFFVVFASVFLSALRNSKAPNALEYEVDLEYSNSRINNLISDSIEQDERAERSAPGTGEKSELFVSDADEADQMQDEIDVLDSDDGEVGDVSRTATKKTADKKAHAKDAKDEFEQQLDDLLDEGNSKIKDKKGPSNLKNKKSDGLIEEVEELGDAKARGNRRKNAFKGENV